MAFSTQYWALNPQIVRRNGMRGNLAYERIPVLEGASAYKAGQLMAYDATPGAATRYITPLASDATAVAGIAANDSSGVTGAAAWLIPIYDGDQLKIRVFDSGTSAAVTTTTNLVRGIKYGIHVASYYCYLDEDDTTNDLLVYDEPMLQNDAHTAWALVHVIASGIQLSAGQ